MELLKEPQVGAVEQADVVHLAEETIENVQALLYSD